MKYQPKLPSHAANHFLNHSKRRSETATGSAFTRPVFHGNTATRSSVESRLGTALGRSSSLKACPPFICHQPDLCSLQTSPLLHVPVESLRCLTTSSKLSDSPPSPKFITLFLANSSLQPVPRELVDLGNPLTGSPTTVSRDCLQPLSPRGSSPLNRFGRLVQATLGRPQLSDLFQQACPRTDHKHLA